MMESNDDSVRVNDCCRWVCEIEGFAPHVFESFQFPTIGKDDLGIRAFTDASLVMYNVVGEDVSSKIDKWLRTNEKKTVVVKFVDENGIVDETWTFNEVSVKMFTPEVVVYNQTAKSRHTIHVILKFTSYDVMGRHENEES